MNGKWRVFSPAGTWWWVESPDTHDSKDFDTWRQAFDYADRMARR